MINLVSKYHKGFDVKLELKDLFIHTTLKFHSELIASSTKQQHTSIMNIEESSSGYRISDAQRRLWVLSQFESGSIAYNMPITTVLDGSCDIDSFKRAIGSVIDRHEFLRTVFREDDTGEVRQWILNKDDLGFEIAYNDYRGDSSQRRVPKPM